MHTEFRLCKMKNSGDPVDKDVKMFNAIQLELNTS